MPALSTPHPHSPARPIRRLAGFAALAVLLSLAACQSTPSTGGKLVAGSQASIEGRVHSVDTAPWAYDGNATVIIDTTTHGRVPVQLPARWNLCKASAPPDPNTLQAGEHVRATGTVSEDGALVVCEQAGHRLERAGG
jgi:hypothetical protein